MPAPFTGGSRESTRVCEGRCRLWASLMSEDETPERRVLEGRGGRRFCLVTPMISRFPATFNTVFYVFPGSLRARQRQPLEEVNV